MELATLAQRDKFWELVQQKGTPCDQFEKLLTSGLLPYLLDANFGEPIDVDAFRRVIGLKPLDTNATLELEELKPPLPMLIVIETDPNPFIPSGLGLKGKGAEHRGMGKVTLEKRADDQLYINGQKVGRHLSPNQKDGNVIQGYKLAEELKDEPTLNARILDALYENQQLIPEDWKSGRTYFWATKFRDAYGNVYVEYLVFYDGQFYRNDCWLFNDWNDDGFAARLEN